ncbi:putative dinucleotide-utilizing enzyme [Arthrobacter sp. UYP6]|uniref:NAD(P)-binding domain-containing protein n=1 Tax=Arthrobacter sp. UYP6 TaxID=1756378 RepID=UPI00339562E7
MTTHLPSTPPDSPGQRIPSPSGNLHVALVGAGRVGTAVARSLLDAGDRVSLSASGDPAQLALMAEIVTPGAEPKGTSDTVADADLVILAVTLHRLQHVDPVEVTDGRRILVAAAGLAGHLNQCRDDLVDFPVLVQLESGAEDGVNTADTE